MFAMKIKICLYLLSFCSKLFTNGNKRDVSNIKNCIGGKYMPRTKKNATFKDNMLAKTLKQTRLPLVSYIGCRDRLAFDIISKMRKVEICEGLK